MADAQKYAEWIVNNRDKSGTPEFDVVVKAYRASRNPVSQVDINGPQGVEGMTGTQKFLAGAGKAFVDVGRGVGQILGLKSQQEIDEAKRLDAPLTRTGAGLAGNVLGNVAAFVPTALIPGVNSLTGAALTGAAMGGIQPVASSDSRASNVATGAAGGILGQGIANAIGRINRPVQSALNPVEQGLAQKAGDMGIPLTIAQRTGSRPLRITESVLENLPFTSDKQLAIKEAQRSAFNRAAAKTVGENADLVTPEVLASAKSRIGQTFQQLSARNVVGLDDDFVNALAKIDSSKNEFSSPAISKAVDRAMELAARGKITGNDYQKIRSSLGKASSGAMKSDPELGQALKTIRNALDEAADKSISQADREAWGQARSQWQALKVLEKASAPTTPDAVVGNVSPAKLANALNTIDPRFKYGQGNRELGDLARIGKAFVQDQVPDSGTAQRQFYQQVMDNPLRLIPGAAGVGSVPIQALLNSRAGQNYFTNGLLPQTPAIGLLGGVGARGLALGMPSLAYTTQQ